MAIEMIRLNLIPDGTPPIVHCKQFDVGRRFRVCVFEGSKPYIFTNETVELDVRKNDTTLVSTDLEVESGKRYVDVVTTEQMCAITGKQEAEIRIYSDDLHTTEIGSLSFYIQVERSVVNGGLVSASEVANLERQVHDQVVIELHDHGAEDTGYNNAYSGLDAENVQAAIDEVNDKVDNIPIIDAYTKEEADEKFAAKDDLTANNVSFDNTDTDLEATNTEDAIKEVDAKVNEKADVSSLAEVATSGSYNDLTDKPTIPEQVQSDWNEADNTKPDYIKNKPNLSTVATSGNYNDLSNKPTIPAAQVNSDWNANSGVSKILNKPNLSTVATTGNYEDLNNKPSIPVIDDTTEVSNKVWSSKKTYDEIVSILPTGVASGSIANFKTSLALPLVSAKFGIEASGGGGTPSTPIPIVGYDSVKVFQRGGNLYNKQNAEVGTISSATGQNANANNRVRSDYFAVKSGATIYFNTNVATSRVYGFYEYDKDKTFLKYTYVANTSGSYVVGENCSFLRLVFSTTLSEISVSDFDNVCINANANHTAYEPYNGSEVIIPLGQTIYGGEVVKDSNGTRLRITSVKKVFGDTANWTLYASGNLTNVFRVVASVTETDKAKNETNQLFNFGVLNTQAHQADDGRMNTFLMGTSRTLYAQVSKADFPSADDFKTFLRNTPLEVSYLLATPSEIALADIDDIVTLIGENNIFADSGNSEVVYKKSIDDAIAELQALILS